MLQGRALNILKRKAGSMLGGRRFRQKITTDLSSNELTKINKAVSHICCLRPRMPKISKEHIEKFAGTGASLSWKSGFSGMAIDIGSRPVRINHNVVEYINKKNENHGSKSS